MIQASSRNHKVVISSMNSPYFRSRFIGVKRYPSLSPDTVSLEDLFAGIEIVVENDEDVLANDSLGVQLSN